MADSAWVLSRTSAVPSDSDAPRHTALVRVTHWITAACFLALLVSGLEIVISHPRFYWGETGNFLTPALFRLPIPSSRALVPNGYSYTLPDQNGWSRALHFQAAWVLVFTGALYLLAGLFTRHFTRNLLPSKTDLSPRSIWAIIVRHLRFWRPDKTDAAAYNPLQELTYVVVIFILFPLMIWTGLAMSLAFDSAFPLAVTSLGGQQSARTIHFFVTILLTLFLFVHVAMVIRSGFKRRMGAMITGGSRA